MSVASEEEPRRGLMRLLSSRSPNNGAYPTVVVDGRGASGKSSLGAWLREALPDLAVVNGDDYFEPHDDPITWGDFNEARFDADVLSVLRTGGRTIELSPYAYEMGRMDPPHTIQVVSAVVVERCFGFGLNVGWDFRIWVEAPRSVCLQRGIQRDTSDELGDRVRRAWEQVWQPREDEYIADRPGRPARLRAGGSRRLSGSRWLAVHESGLE
jgi:uridine kinase